MVDVAAFNSSTDGGLELLTKAACKTGELELNMSVMKPMIARPRRYSSVVVSSPSSPAAVDDDDGGEGDNVDVDDLGEILSFFPSACAADEKLKLLVVSPFLLSFLLVEAPEAPEAPVTEFLGVAMPISVFLLPLKVWGL